MIAVVIIHPGRTDRGEQYVAHIEIFVSWSTDGRTVNVFGDHFAAGEDVDGRGRGTGTGHGLFHAKAIAIVGVSAAARAISRADGAVLRVVDERIVGVIGHVAAGIITKSAGCDPVRARADEQGT